MKDPGKRDWRPGVERLLAQPRDLEGPEGEIRHGEESSSGSGGGVSGAIVGMAAGGLGGAGISLFTFSDQKVECIPADNQD